MYNKILVPLALDHGYGFKAIELARNLKDIGGQIIALHVFEPVHDTVSLYVPADHMQNVRKEAEQELARRIGEENDVEAVVLSGHSAREITRYAKNIVADCIIIGSHKPDLQDYLLGSTASRIVRHAPCAVHVLR